MERQLISSHSGTVNLYHSYTIPCIWITSLLSIFSPCSTVHYFSILSGKFLLEICSVVVLLVMAGNATTKIRAICGRSTPGSITRHAQVSREPPSTLSLLSVWRSMYRTPNRVSHSSEVAKRIISEGTGNGCERRKTPRGGRQVTLFNLLRCSSNLCHYHWNKRA